MIEENKDLFAKFAAVHAAYGLDEEKNQAEFNREGEKVLEVIRNWENKLCRQSEKAGYAGFTGNLAEKFQKEIKSHFSLIDHIGIIIKEKPKTGSEFKIDQIKLK